MRVPMFAFVLLLFAVPLTAQDGVPLAVIDGPTESPAGELCHFDAGSSTGVGYSWIVSGPSNTLGRWHLYEGEGVKDRYLSFSSPEPGMYTFTLAVALDNVAAQTQLFLYNGVKPDPDPDVDPEPDPIDPPLPTDQKWQVVFIYESEDLDNYTPEHQSILKSLTFRQRLAAAGHIIVEGGIFDKDGINRDGDTPKRIKPFYAAVRDTKLPVMCIAPIESGTIQVFPLPVDEDAVMVKLGGEKL